MAAQSNPGDGVYMKSCRSITAFICAIPFCLWAGFVGAQTINFGDSLPGGPIAPGYAGFQWGSGADQAVNYVSDTSSPYFLYLTGPAADITEFSSPTLFNLNSIDFQILVSGQTAEDTFNNYSTVISGYRGTTLVGSVTENYPGFPSDSFTGLNLNGVNRIQISTTDTSGYLDPETGNPIVALIQTYAGAFVDQVSVSTSQVMAPEIDPASAAAGLTLLFGSLAVLLAGSRVRRSQPSVTRHEI